MPGMRFGIRPKAAVPRTIIRKSSGNKMNLLRLKTGVLTPNISNVWNLLASREPEKKKKSHLAALKYSNPKSVAFPSCCFLCAKGPKAKWGASSGREAGGAWIALFEVQKGVPFHKKGTLGHCKASLFPGWLPQFYCHSLSFIWEIGTVFSLYRWKRGLSSLVRIQISALERWHSRKGACLIHGWSRFIPRHHIWSLKPCQE